jgi:hypothetical protein
LNMLRGILVDRFLGYNCDPTLVLSWEGHHA